MPPNSSSAEIDWHAMGGADALRQLASDPRHGLAEVEACARLERHGHNRLAETPPRPAWLLFLAEARKLALRLWRRS